MADSDAKNYIDEGVWTQQRVIEKPNAGDAGRGSEGSHAAKRQRVAPGSTAPGRPGAAVVHAPACFSRDHLFEGCGIEGPWLKHLQSLGGFTSRLLNGVLGLCNDALTWLDNQGSTVQQARTLCDDLVFCAKTPPQTASMMGNAGRNGKSDAAAASKMWPVRAPLLFFTVA